MVRIFIDRLLRKLRLKSEISVLHTQLNMITEDERIDPEIKDEMILYSLKRIEELKSLIKLDN